MLKKKAGKRLLTVALAGAVALQGIPATALAADLQAGEVKAADGLLADFDFDQEMEGGGFSGGGAKAAGTYTLQQHNGGNALYLDGSQCLNVTAENGESLLTGQEEITISYDAKPTKGEKSWTFYAAPDGNTQSYLYEKYLGIVHTTGKVQWERYFNSGQRPENNLEAEVTNDWIHVDVVVTEGHTQLYVDGELQSESDSDYLLTDILGKTSVFLIGKGNWESGEYYSGWLDNYRIYGRALTEAEIQEQYEELEEENDPMLQAYYNLAILNGDDVRGNLPLVREGLNGASVSWTSSNPEVVSDEAEGGLYDGGVVKRPAPGEEPVEVELEATLTMDGYEPMTKEFTVTVQPMPEDLDTDYTAGYLWSHFGISGGYEKVFFGFSEDGLTWGKLNKNAYGIPQPVLESDAPGSELGVRDPHLIRSPEGDKYWILGTDSHAEGGGPGENGYNQLSASQSIVVWESTDLVNWSEPRLVYAGFANAGCVWAPEAIYDEAAGDYLVYWSSRDKSLNGTDQNALRVYVSRTRDFHTFSEPKVWLSEDVDGSEVNIIDTTIVRDGDQYYRFSTSDWNTVIDVSDTLDDQDVLDVRVDPEKSTPNGSWTRLVSRGGSSAAGFDGREGFTVYQLPDGTWCAMGDNGGYRAFLTDDLSKGTFTATEASFPDGGFRHGTVMRLSKTEQERILKAFGGDGGSGEEAVSEEPVLEYNFEEDLGKQTMTDTGKGNDIADNGVLYGGASVVYDEEKGSNVLQLDGNGGSYGEIPQGFFDGRDTLSISMDVKSNLSEGNFLTFAFGKDRTYYDNLRIRGNEVRFVMTTESWSNEKEVKIPDGADVGVWQNVTVTIDGSSMKLYVDGELASENPDTGIRTSDFGTGLLSYLGKSFYDEDRYFSGSYDNFRIYNRVLAPEEVLENAMETTNLLSGAMIGTVPEDPANTMGTDNHTAVTSAVNTAKREVTSYVRKGTDLTAVPVKLSTLNEEVALTMDGETWENGSALDLTEDVQITLTYGDKKTETWTIKTPSIASNPVLPGQYSDPDIDYFDGKYWIYPTTDGYPGWDGSVFHAFSSENLVDWTDEGVILDVKDKNPGLNEQGVQIASSAWSNGNAWAPSIEEKNGKYYFYYCGNVNDAYTGQCGSGKAIGVAVSDSPTGPFVAKETPIIDLRTCENAGIGFSGQVIDPSIFTDDDGTSYLFFGNSEYGCAMVELTEDMMGIKTETLKRITGMKDFRESVVVTKRDGLYHFTWSCDDTGSPNYHVNYGTAKELDGKVMYRYTLLQKDEAGDMLGTAHQSILYMPETDTCYMAYHRFYTPLGVYTDGLGSHRETCIEEITFDENGFMKPLVPTMEGINTELTVTYEAQEGGSIQGETVQTVYRGQSTTQVTAVAEEGYEFVKWDDGSTEASRSETNVQADQTYTAMFRKVQTPESPDEKVTVTYTAAAGGRIAGMATQTIDKGQNTSQVTAVADAGYAFSKWSDGKTEASRRDTNVQQNATYTAIFVKEEVQQPGGSDTETKEPEAAKVKLSEKTLRMGVKEKVQLKATVSPQGASQKVTWKSSKKSVAAVSKNGKLTAKRPGTAKITVTTENGKKATCKVVVKKAPKKLTAKVTNKTLKKGKSFQVKVNLPKNTASYKIRYTSSKKSVASVNANGKVTAKKRGRAVITAKTYNGKKTKIVVRVK